MSLLAIMVSIILHMAEVREMIADPVYLYGV